MTTIVLDHIRRWWWLWTGSCVCCAYIVGAGTPLKPDLSNAWFPLAIYLGSVQLTQDLMRGDLLRVLRAMPVSERTVGRAWWWVSVGVPGLTLGAIVGLVFILSPVLTGKVLPPVACFDFWLTNALLFGPLFFFLTGIPAVGFGRAGSGRGYGCLFSLLFCVSTFAMIYFYRLFPPPTTRWWVFVAVGSVLTVAGWFRAEALARERLRTILPSRPTAGHGIPSLSGAGMLSTGYLKGHGGLKLLFRIIFGRMALMGLFWAVLGGGAMVLTRLLTEALTQTKIMWDSTSVIVSAQMLFWLICWQTIRTALHVRFLRTLPVSTLKLAAVLVLAPVTAMFVVLCCANLVFALYFPAVALSVPAMLREGCLVQIAFATLVVPLVVWRGFDFLSFVVVLAVLVAGPLSLLIMKAKLPTTMSLGVSLIVVSGCLLLTKLLLERSGSVYRPRKNQFGDRLWGRVG